MLININRIKEKGLLLNDQVDLDESLLIEENSFFLEEVQYSIFFSREGTKIKAKGRIQTAVSLRCVGCLENFELRVNSKFDIILFPAHLVDLNSVALHPDEMEYIFYEEDTIDLAKILMEQVNLFIPFNPTCKTNCKGICPNCGMNLNYHKCQCESSVSEFGLLFDKIKR